MPSPRKGGTVPVRRRRRPSASNGGYVVPGAVASAAWRQPSSPTGARPTDRNGRDSDWSDTSDTSINSSPRSGSRSSGSSTSRHGSSKSSLSTSSGSGSSSTYSCSSSGSGSETSSGSSGSGSSFCSCSVTSCSCSSLTDDSSGSSSSGSSSSESSGEDEDDDDADGEGTTPERGRQQARCGARDRNGSFMCRYSGARGGSVVDAGAGADAAPKRSPWKPRARRTGSVLSSSLSAISNIPRAARKSRRHKVAVLLAPSCPDAADGDGPGSPVFVRPTDCCWLSVGGNLEDVDDLAVLVGSPLEEDEDDDDAPLDDLVSAAHARTLRLSADISPCSSPSSSYSSAAASLPDDADCSGSSSDGVGAGLGLELGDEYTVSKPKPGVSAKCAGAGALHLGLRPRQHL